LRGRTKEAPVECLDHLKMKSYYNRPHLSLSLVLALD
jgi:hypothetical protein